MARQLNYEAGYKYLWNRVQMAIDLLKKGNVTNEQFIYFLSLAQADAEEKCVSSVARGSGSRASHNRMRQRIK